MKGALHSYLAPLHPSSGATMHHRKPRPSLVLFITHCMCIRLHTSLLTSSTAHLQIQYIQILAAKIPLLQCPCIALARCMVLQGGETIYTCVSITIGHQSDHQWREVELQHLQASTMEETRQQQTVHLVSNSDSTGSAISALHCTTGPSAPLA